MEYGLTIEKAHEKIKETIRPLPAEKALLTEALGRILAEDIESVYNLPAEEQSATDGYALSGLDLSAGQRFTLNGFLKLGDYPQEAIKTGEAVGVLTGGALPPGTTAVVPHEKTINQQNGIEISEEILPGANIKQVGEDFRLGEKLAKKGEIITPELIGLLAAMGFPSVNIYRPIKAAILAIGENIIDFSQVPLPGQTRDANGPMLAAMIGKVGGEITDIKLVPGSKSEQLAEILSELAGQVDLILITGGTYAGQNSQAQSFLAKAGANLLYWGTDIQPGGHNGLAEYRGIPIFAFSGHPAACAVGFYIFAAPSIRYMQGLEFRLQKIEARCTNSYGKTAKSHRMVRGYAFPTVSGWKVTVLPGQKPSMLRSLINCNALIHMSPGKKGLQADELVNVVLI